MLASSGHHGTVCICGFIRFTTYELRLLDVEKYDLSTINEKGVRLAIMFQGHQLGSTSFPDTSCAKIHCIPGSFGPCVSHNAADNGMYTCTQRNSATNRCDATSSDCMLRIQQDLLRVDVVEEDQEETSMSRGEGAAGLTIALSVFAVSVALACAWALVWWHNQPSVGTPADVALHSTNNLRVS